MANIYKNFLNKSTGLFSILLLLVCLSNRAYAAPMSGNYTINKPAKDYVHFLCAAVVRTIFDFLQAILMIFTFCTCHKLPPYALLNWNFHLRG